MTKDLAPDWGLASRPGDLAGADEEGEARDGYVLPTRPLRT